MKKIVFALASVASLFALSGCGDYFDSPERKAYREFVKHCQAEPKAADCVEFNKTRDDAQVERK